MQTSHHHHHSLHIPQRRPSPTPPATLLLPLITATTVPCRRLIRSSASKTSCPPPATRLPADQDGAGDASDSASAAFWDYQSLFVSQRSECHSAVPLRVVEGAVPPDFPAGTYYLIGPGLFSDDHGVTVNPLDGHGYLRAFHFPGGGGAANYAARYVATEAALEEGLGTGSGWRFTHRGPFSVLRGGKQVGNVKVMKNVANTTVLSWGGRLLCLWEGGVPYEIDPASLDTVGPIDVVGDSDGRRLIQDWTSSHRRARRGPTLLGLRDLGIDVAAHVFKPFLHGVYKMPLKRLLAHYKVDAKRNRLLLLSCQAEDMVLPRANFTFYEFDCNFELKHRKEFVIQDQVMIHDWAFTDSYYIIFANRIKIDLPGSLLAVAGLQPMISALALNPSQPTTPIYLLPRSSDGGEAGDRGWSVPVEAPAQLWVIHIGNAFEERNSDGALEINMQVTACSYKWFNFWKSLGYNLETGWLDPSSANVAEDKEALLPHIHQVSIEPDQNNRCSVTGPSNRWQRIADFPAINLAFSGRQNKYVYAATTSGSRRLLPHFPFDSVVKMNCSDGSAVSWWAGRRRFLGEPIYVPRGTEEEDDGYILVVEYAVLQQTCYLVILDARKIGEADAVKAKLEVPKHLTFPFGFHGFWSAV